MCDQQSCRSDCTYVQSDQNLCKSHEYSMTVKLLTEHHLEFLSLKGGCTGSSESTLVNMPHCCKSCVTGQLWFQQKKNFFLGGGGGGGGQVVLSVTSHIKCIVACCLINVVYLTACAFIGS